jgi:Na+/proline symporter
MFLALAYFGCDQSQVQRYLTGKSVAQSKLSLLFNAAAKVPMQFFILFVGAMVFVFYIFEPPPLLFERPALEKLESSGVYGGVKSRFDRAFEARREAADVLIAARHARDSQRQQAAIGGFRAAQTDLDAVRHDAGTLVETGFNDTNYIFLSFVTRYLPAGMVGLIIAVIFAAAMSAISGEVNSLATVTVIDIYKRHLNGGATDAHYLLASRVATAFWGLYAVMFAQFGKNLGSLIEAVNRLGSLFYGSLLGVFTLAFFVPRANGTGAFLGMIVAETAIFAAYLFTGISFLWYNVIGCVAVVATGLLLRKSSPE